ncbi:myeloid protein 1-like [Alosa sapidissima]|uniref:myeloid protein 1-like n=1 Tax=Alosa sapidissima TaxID=34773 RepID=UPI001C0895AB|nr:myeloid protein 1-like [Alosa sapidissima]
MKVAIVLAVLVSTVFSTDQLFGHQEEPSHERLLVKFGPLCSGNPTNQKRGCDVKWGCGNYGARRTHGPHKGLDIQCNDGATVYAPFDVKLNGKAAPNAEGVPRDDLPHPPISVTDITYIVWMMKCSVTLQYEDVIIIRIIIYY